MTLQYMLGTSRHKISESPLIVQPGASTCPAYSARAAPCLPVRPDSACLRSTQQSRPCSPWCSAWSAARPRRASTWHPARNVASDHVSVVVTGQGLLTLEAPPRPRPRPRPAESPRAGLPSIASSILTPKSSPSSPRSIPSFRSALISPVLRPW